MRKNETRSVIVGTSEMFAILGITEVHLGRLSKAGDIPEPLERGRWDAAAVVQAYLTYRLRSKPADSLKEEERLLAVERRRKVSADAEAAERENAVANKQLIDSAYAEEIFFEAARRSRNAWLSWPASIAPLIAADLDVPVEPVSEALEAHVNEHIARLGEPVFATG